MPLTEEGAWILPCIYALSHNYPIPEGADLGITGRSSTTIISELCRSYLLGIQVSFDFFDSSLLERTGACGV